MDIKMQEMSLEEAKKLGIDNWSTWSCGISEFDWEYSEEETAYVFEGEVEVTAYGKTYHIKEGMLVTFPKGMQCIWNVKKAIHKAYKFNQK